MAIRSARRIVWIMIAAAVSAALLAGCGSPTTPTPRAAGQTPAPTPGLAEWEVTWNDWVERANQEGRLSVTVFRAEDRENVEEFQRFFPGIRVEVAVISGRDFASRVPQERQAGRYNYDVYMSGGGTALSTLIPAGIQTGDPMLANTREILIRPDVLGDENWIGNFDDHWADMDTKNILFNMIANAGVSSFHINTNEISANDLSRAEDFLRPEFRGRICTDDPASPGASATFFTQLLVTSGEPMLRRILTEADLVISTDGRRMAEDLIRGTMVACIGAELEPFFLQGVGGHLEEVQLEFAGIAPDYQGKIVHTCCGTGKNSPDLRGFYSAGIGGPILMTNPPNPYAARVYINWLLTREGQEAWHGPLYIDCSPRADMKQHCQHPDQLEEGLGYVSFNMSHNADYRLLSQDIARELTR